MLVLGLTGSIAMGKSTTAAMFAAEGVPVFDADATVHRLYAGAAVAPVAAAFSDAVADGRIDRGRLAAALAADPAALPRLEAIVHPLVRAEEEAFRRRADASGIRTVLLDVPLLLESGPRPYLGAVVVVTAPEPVQRARLLARPGMTEAKRAALLARQMPDAEKRRRAHFLIDTGRGIDAARAEVKAILRATAGIAAGA